MASNQQNRVPYAWELEAQLQSAWQRLLRLAPTSTSSSHSTLPVILKQAPSHHALPTLATKLCRAPRSQLGDSYRAWLRTGMLSISP